MKDISENEWKRAISDWRDKMDTIFKDTNSTFEEMFDSEIILRLLEGGLKLKQDEKNKVQNT